MMRGPRDLLFFTSVVLTDRSKHQSNSFWSHRMFEISSHNLRSFWPVHLILMLEDRILSACFYFFTLSVLSVSCSWVVSFGPLSYSFGCLVLGIRVGTIPRVSADPALSLDFAVWFMRVKRIGWHHSRTWFFLLLFRRAPGSNIMTCIRKIEKLGYHPMNKRPHFSFFFSLL